MSSAIRATAPSSGLSLFKSQSFDGQKRIPGRNNSQRRDKSRKQQRPRKGATRVKTTEGDDKNIASAKMEASKFKSELDQTSWMGLNANIDAGGPLMRQQPENFGFQRIQHTKRGIPKYLIQQRPRIKSATFRQDPWDAENQQKMLAIENEISDPTQLWETLKKMREVERRVMEDKKLVDRADSAKDLNDAIVFEGTCQDMCPIFERARRSVENNVVRYEKEDQNSKRVSRFKALKVFARPAAAAAPSLPSDVRPPHVLMRTLDYIVENIVPKLPQCEGFLWDRMRSIRQDFTYQNYSGPEAVDCNERIVRIHLLILHIMAKSDNEYSIQQELEQLHKALITLSEIYDEVRASGGQCPNEAEFRAYSLLSRTRDPEYDKMAQSLPQHIFDDHNLQLALCFRRILSNSNYSERGHIKTENGLNLYSRFFQLIQSDQVSFLMGSFLEVYLNEIRFYALKSLSHAINRKHKPIALKVLREELMFNNDDEVEIFCKHYSIEINENGAKLTTLSHHSHMLSEITPLKQSYLHCVDDKLQRSSIHELINSGKKNIDTVPGGHTGNISPPQDTNPVPPKFNSLTNGISIQNNFNDQRFQTQDLQSNPNLGTSLRFGNVIENGSSIPHNVEAKTKSEIDNKEQKSNEIEDKIRKKLEVQRKIKEARDQERQLKFEQDQKNKEIEAKRLREEKERIKAAAIEVVAQELVQGVVNRQVQDLVREGLDKQSRNKHKLDVLTEELYNAFLHERLYLVALEATADHHQRSRYQRHAWKIWRSKLEARKRKSEQEKKTREELSQVSKRLGVPEFKRIRVDASPSGFSFTMPSSSRNNWVHTPISNEKSQFKIPAHKNSEVWKPIDLNKVYCKKIAENMTEEYGSDSEKMRPPVFFSVFIFSRNWESVSARWLLGKFGLPDKAKQTATYGDTYLKLQVATLQQDFSPRQLESLQMLVFNSGVTDNNIFDLEMKLKQDGERLIELAHGITLNTNYKFSILVVYWESAENPLPTSEIAKFLKIDKITRVFAAVLKNVDIVKLTSDCPHKALEDYMAHAASVSDLELTERGVYNQNLRQRALPPHTGPLNPYVSSQSLDEKLQKALEQEKEKHQREKDRNNTYAYLQSHVAASPRTRKRKLPVLLSENKNKFKTPLAIRPAAHRTSSQSMPSVPSHLVTKFKPDRSVNPPPRAPAPTLPTALPLPPCGTPSHSRHQKENPNGPLLLDTPSITASAGRQGTANTSGISNVTFESPFSTPASRLIQSPVQSAAPTHEAHANVLELKELIASVKKKLEKH